MMRPVCTLDPDPESMWVRLYVFPVEDHGASVILAGGVTPPGPGKGKDLGVDADTPEDAERLKNARPVPGTTLVA